jgi:hypothetical protein
MEPEMLHTACYRGFYATYEVKDDGLFLRELTLREKNGKYLPLAGVEADVKKSQGTYHDLEILVPFTGKMRLAKGFIEELYVHMGFQKPTAFKYVYDMAFQDGKLVELKDRSKDVERMRGAFKKKYAEDPFSNIDAAFSLDMDLE